MEDFKDPAALIAEARKEASIIRKVMRRSYAESDINAEGAARLITRLADALTAAQERVNSVNPAAVATLRNNQRQLDFNGDEVGVSRQALDEVLIIFPTPPQPDLPPADQTEEPS